MLKQLFIAAVILACVLGALGGVGGVIWAALIMGLVSAVVQDRARENLELENAELRAEIERLRARVPAAQNTPELKPDRAPQSARALPDGSAFLASLRGPPSERK